MKLKICGLKYFQNIEDVGRLQPEYMGFIFWKKSSRYCDDIIPELPRNIKKIGVFVDATQEEIEEKIKQYQLHGIQLHGKESVAFCDALKKKNTLIIKTFAIDETFNFDLLDSYEAVCDFYLFDTKGKLPGGNGMTFNWDVLSKFQQEKPYFLSGGIGIEALKKIKQLPVLPYALDVNSKFEIKPGLKNIDTLKLFQNHLKPLL